MKQEERKEILDHLMKPLTTAITIIMISSAQYFMLSKYYLYDPSMKRHLLPIQGVEIHQ